METFRIVSVLVAVPAFLALADLLARTTGLHYLLFQPMATIAYQAFSDPRGRRSRLRCLVLSPVLGAVVGALTVHFFGDTPWSMAGSSLLVVGLMLLLRSEMPPALAVNVLALFIGAGTPWYPAGVFLATAGVALAFWVWRWVGFEAVGRRETTASHP